MEIQEIKAQLSLAQVLDHYGLKPDKHGKMNCPFHEDKTPSFQVYHKTQTCYCFSSNCPTNGKVIDVIDFIMHKEGSDKHNAILKAQSLISGVSTPVEQTREQFLTKMFAYFKNAVYSSKPARDYITGRAIDHHAIDVGYNTAQFHHGKRKEETLINNCVKYGLLRETTMISGRSKDDKAYNVFGKWCIVFPLKNRSGQVSGLYFRSTINDTDQKHFYLKDRQGLYPCYPNPETRKLILTEAIIDAATLIQVSEIAAEYGTLACYGTNGFTEEHEQAIKELEQLDEVIFFFDGDEAGQKAVEKYTEQIKQLKPSVKITSINTPEGEDVNSLAQGHEIGILAHLIEKRNDPRFIFSFEKKKVVQPEITEEKIEKPASAKKIDPETQPQPEQKITAPLNAKLDTSNPERIIFETEVLHITMWGGIEKENLSRLRISVHVRSKNDKYKTYRDDCNLYSHPQVNKLVQSISESLELPSPHVSQTITELTEQLEAYRLEERNAQLVALRPRAYEMNTQEQKQAYALLKGKDLVKHTLKLITQSGLIGEQKNGLLLFFLYLSRITDEPLHAIIFGKSGSGKTYLQTRVSECLPTEAVRPVTSLSENTLYYSPKGFWEHKVLLIEDLEGVYNAFLPLREFMSKQSISKLTTDKDAKGNNVQKVLTVEGPICVSGATTKESIYEDNANRSFLIHIDESAQHMDEVMEFQRKQKAGIVNEAQQQEARQILQNAQRLLQNIKVINPYALELRIPDMVFKKLRTNMHYLRLIEIVTLYHQCQREIKTDSTGARYIETDLGDIAIANWLVKDTLLRKSDELSGEQREFFESLKSKSAKDSSFFAKDLRKTLRMHPMKLARYLVQLESRGYIKRTGGNRKQGFEYQVNEWDDYKLLKEGVDILDSKLEQLRQKMNGKSQFHTSFTPHSQTKM
ncbi:MAG: toprim domain-containing protein [Verrucomicrobia bacterium]|nr:toprim domain-containing protein [Verrucomicrobiota bacterium]